MKDDREQEKESEPIEEMDDTSNLVKKIAKLKEDLKNCQKERASYLAGWQRAQADFINYRRRQEEQMAEWLKMAEEKVIRDILPVVDALDSFEKNHAGHDEKLGRKHLTEGLCGVKRQLVDILSKNGVQEIKSFGEKFNPEFHEAVEQMESDSEPGIITEETQKGYMMNGKVLRPAKVKVIK